MIRDFLIINCTGKNDSIALKVDNKFFFKKLQINLTKNEKLALETLSFLKENKVNINNEFSLIVNSGPGSFSGIRTALAVAKGIQIVSKVNIYSYNNFLLYAAPHLNKKTNIISVQRTYNSYYYSKISFKDFYTFTAPKKLDFNFLQSKDSIIIAAQEIVNDSIFNNICRKKIKIVGFNLKNVEILAENNLFENELIKPLYLR
jgi:tRNA A37 threonylcarbamoyladenosine modification protein TsaB